jgi:predicted RNA-binding protein with PIN domain
MPERYFIDGYNLLHADPAWSALAQEDLEAARESLVESVSRWCARLGHQACVFWDGQGRMYERVAPDPGRPGIEVVFTSSRLSADALIERGVYAARKRDSVIVVTSDRGISDFCLGLGALTMRSANFLALLGELPPAVRPSASQARDGLGRLEDRIGPRGVRRLRGLHGGLESDERQT